MNTNPTFGQDHSTEPYQLFVAISGRNQASIRKVLSDMIEELDNGKPRQGTYLYSDYTREVITPKWNGTDY